VPQSEILGYMEHCAKKYELHPHIRFGAEVERARFDEARGAWRIHTRDGETVEAEVLVSGVGQLNRPSVPDIPGLESFRGPRFHSARWDPGCELAGRRVAVIGNAASAIQLVPKIAPEVAHLTIFQRSANWMVPQWNRPYREDERRRFARHPWLARLYRGWIWLLFELQWPVLFRRRGLLGALARRYERLSLRYMRSVVKDPELQEKLVPDYPMGGKRLLLSDEYYPTLNRENVEVVTSGIERVEADAIRTRDGRRHPVDVIVLATGFQTTSFLAPMEVEGRGGRSLRRDWKDAARAYLGITLPCFPNFFVMYGPNTNLGHNSILFMLECQGGYIVDCVRKLRDRGLRWLELREDAMSAWEARLQRELARTVWARTGKSWYKTTDGTITNNWSGSTLRYWWKTRKADLSDYRQEPRPDASRADADRAEAV